LDEVDLVAGFEIGVLTSLGFSKYNKGGGIFINKNKYNIMIFYKELFVLLLE